MLSSAFAEPIAIEKGDLKVPRREVKHVLAPVAHLLPEPRRVMGWPHRSGSAGIGARAWAFPGTG